MRILVVGDPHGEMPEKIPKNLDYILLTGDIGSADRARKYFFKYTIKGIDWTTQVSKREIELTYSEMNKSSIQILKRLTRIAPVYMVDGNVEPRSDRKINTLNKKYGWSIPRWYSEIRKIRNLHRINWKIADLGELTVAGVPCYIDEQWIKDFGAKDKDKIARAAKQTRKAREFFRRLPKVDIVLSHIPPYHVLDKVGPPAPEKWRGKHAGSPLLLDYIKKKHPRYVFCGHIHEDKGVKMIGETEVRNVGFNGDFYLLEI
ncbi:MAG: metallophosphoesterase [Nanoarchaeota archaeon]|nr:metallophosphoesterase [Nanoarchaeota archaeon]